MKKLPVIIVLSLFSSLLFVSCKKDYTCTCTIQAPPDVFDTTLVFKSDIDDRSKKQAEAECRGSEDAYQRIAALFLTTANCDLEKQ